MEKKNKKKGITEAAGKIIGKEDHKEIVCWMKNAK